jgi:hypothetical protein
MHEWILKAIVGIGDGHPSWLCKKCHLVVSNDSTKHHPSLDLLDYHHRSCEDRVELKLVEEIMMK